MFSPPRWKGTLSVSPSGGRGGYIHLSSLPRRRMNSLLLPGREEDRNIVFLPLVEDLIVFLPAGEENDKYLPCPEINRFRGLYVSLRGPTYRARGW